MHNTIDTAALTNISLRNDFLIFMILCRSQKSSWPFLSLGMFLECSEIFGIFQPRVLMKSSFKNSAFVFVKNRGGGRNKKKDGGQRKVHSFRHNSCQPASPLSHRFNIVISLLFLHQLSLIFAHQKNS